MEDGKSVALGRSSGNNLRSIFNIDLEQVRIIEG